MNVYLMGKIGINPVDVTDSFALRRTAGDYVMVHGARNAEVARKALWSGLSVAEVKRWFCGSCGELLPCGCAHPRAQSRTKGAGIVSCRG